MTDREKVIKGLETFKADLKPYAGNHADWKKVDDAISLLKAQEPRVLTLEEVNYLPYRHVIIETNKNEPIRWLDALIFSKNINFSFDFITLGGRARLLGVEYNREWRCWTSRPTEEQREAVPWLC